MDEQSRSQYFLLFSLLNLTLGNTKTYIFIITDPSLFRLPSEVNKAQPLLLGGGTFNNGHRCAEKAYEDNIG